MATRSSHKLRFAVIATDVALFSVFEKKLHVLLMRIHRPPFFINTWGLPGGLIHPKEIATRAAIRHLSEKGGYKNVYMEQLYTFSDVKRDPRGRVVSVAYLALIPFKRAKLSQRKEVEWRPVNSLTKLAYDHNEIVETAVKRLAGRLAYTNIVQHLLPHAFTLTELQQIYEVVLGRKLDKRNFRKKILTLHLMKKVGQRQAGKANRPAQLYTFKTKKLQSIEIL